jgi:nucleotidyltransferase substrate binding protein (TIGR01987 family)
MTPKDIRWIQRFNNFLKALNQLTEAVELAEQRELTKLEEQGVIQAFEFTHELAWNTLKDFLENRGVQNIYGSKDVTREAFKAGLIDNGEIWMDMIKSRNLATHTYNQTTALEIMKSVTESYFTEFNALKTKLDKLKESELLI